MKRWKGWMLAVLSAAVLVLSMRPLPVLAEETKEETAVIDSSRAASLTVRFLSGTEGANGIEGAEFTIYKIAEIGWGGEPLAILYDAAGNPIVFSASFDAALMRSDVEKSYTNGTVKNGANYTGITDKNGEIRFEAIPHGFYLVVETKSTTDYRAAVPFVASVPYTDHTEQGAAWAYEAEVYPKALKKTDLTPERATGDLKTGDETKTASFALLAVFAGGAMAAASRSGRGRRKNDA